MGKKIDKRKPITPNSKRKLMLLDMTDTVYGNNHEYGKILKRMFPSQTNPDLSCGSAQKDPSVSGIGPFSRKRTE